MVDRLRFRTVDRCPGILRPKHIVAAASADPAAFGAEAAPLKRSGQLIFLAPFNQASAHASTRSDLRSEFDDRADRLAFMH